MQCLCIFHICYQSISKNYTLLGAQSSLALQYWNKEEQKNPWKVREEKISSSQHRVTILMTSRPRHNFREMQKCLVMGFVLRKQDSMSDSFSYKWLLVSSHLKLFCFLLNNKQTKRCLYTTELEHSIELNLPDYSNNPLYPVVTLFLALDTNILI